MSGLTDFQSNVADLFFSPPSSRGFLLAGGGGLLAPTRSVAARTSSTHGQTRTAAADDLMATYDRRMGRTTGGTAGQCC
jgi:hypothetical protein